MVCRLAAPSRARLIAAQKMSRICAGRRRHVEYLCDKDNGGTDVHRRSSVQAWSDDPSYGCPRKACFVRTSHEVRCWRPEKHITHLPLVCTKRLIRVGRWQWVAVHFSIGALPMGPSR